MRQVLFDQVFRYIKIRGDCVGKSAAAVGDVWGWLKLAWGPLRKVMLYENVPTQVFCEWGLRRADLRVLVRQGCYWSIHQRHP